MELIVRAVDVGSGNTKFVTGVTGADIRCASFPSIAYPSSGETPHWPASERRKTVCIPVGPLFYEVGPDVGLAADTFRAKQLHDEYTESPEYTALLRGALSMMKVPHIDLLIVGLPVALFSLKKSALEKAMVGEHQVGGGKSVTVAWPSVRCSRCCRSRKIFRTQCVSFPKSLNPMVRRRWLRSAVAAWR